MAIENSYSERMSLWRSQINKVGHKRSVSPYKNARRVYLYCLKNGAVVKFGDGRRDITDEFLMKLKFFIEMGSRPETERHNDPYAWAGIAKMLSSSYRGLLELLKHSTRRIAKADKGKVPFVLSWQQLKYFNGMIKRLGFEYNQEGEF